MKDAHAWKYENAPPPKVVNAFAVRRKAIDEAKEVVKAELVRLSAFNSTGTEEAKGILRRVNAAIERLA
jgi:hypothetical protein